MAEMKTIFDLEQTIKENGLLKQWKAIMQDYRDDKLAKEVIKALEAEGKDAAIDVLTDAWHNVGIKVSGLTKKEYFENPDVPLWERNDMIWNEEAEEWEDPSEDSEPMTQEELMADIFKTQKKFGVYHE